MNGFLKSEVFTNWIRLLLVAVQINGLLTTHALYSVAFKCKRLNLLLFVCEISLNIFMFMYTSLSKHQFIAVCDTHFFWLISSSFAMNLCYKFQMKQTAYISNGIQSINVYVDAYSSFQSMEKVVCAKTFRFMFCVYSL